MIFNRKLNRRNDVTTVVVKSIVNNTSSWQYPPRHRSALNILHY